MSAQEVAQSVHGLGRAKVRFATPEMALEHLRRLAKRPATSRRAYVYFIGGEAGPVKIGSTRNVGKRLATLQIGSPVRLSILATVSGQGSTLECIYHTKFKAHRLLGEWFERCPEIEAEIRRLQKESI
jgi:hypothetical protein